MEKEGRGLWEEGENAHVAKSPLAVAHVKSSLKIKVGQKLQIIFVLLGLRCGVCVCVCVPNTHTCTDTPSATSFFML